MNLGFTDATLLRWTLSNLEDNPGDRRDRLHAHRLVVYALILVLVAILVVVILLAIGDQIANLFTNIVAALK